MKVMKRAHYERDDCINLLITAIDVCGSSFYYSFLVRPTQQSNVECSGNVYILGLAGSAPCLWL